MALLNSESIQFCSRILGHGVQEYKEELRPDYFVLYLNDGKIHGLQKDAEQAVLFPNSTRAYPHNCTYS